jgi:hypothetical protein
MKASGRRRKSACSAAAFSASLEMSWIVAGVEDWVAGEAVARRIFEAGTAMVTRYRKNCYLLLLRIECYQDSVFVRESE